MADPDFETRLGRWFSETPALPDEDAFARRVSARLDRAWMVRRFLIGLAGLVGGSMAAGQMLGAHMFRQVEGVGAASATTFSQGTRALAQLHLLTDLPVGSEVIWMGAGLAVLGMLLFGARALEEL